MTSNYDLGGANFGLYSAGSQSVFGRRDGFRMGEKVCSGEESWFESAKIACVYSY